MKRQIINIDEDKCDGCALCIPNCHEGALQIIDGKARLISDLFCDGLGACLGHCPQEAITLEEREAEPYNERMVMAVIVTQGRNTILAHLQHLREHNEEGFLKEAVAYLKENNIDMSEQLTHSLDHGTEPLGCGCSGSLAQDFREQAPLAAGANGNSNAMEVPSELRQWPVQLHLLNPRASYLQGADLVLASDCSAFSVGNFHAQFIKGKALAIACPKLDQGKEAYIEKLATMVSESKVNTITVIMMEVPCCGGLSQLAKVALQQAGRKIPLKEVYLSIRGEVLSEEWA
ncbi:MAG: 4Fe-4S dicluster domain-containing protein [Bacteroidota bacterium]